MNASEHLPAPDPQTPTGAQKNERDKKSNRPNPAYLNTTSNESKTPNKNRRRSATFVKFNLAQTSKTPRTSLSTRSPTNGGDPRPPIPTSIQLKRRCKRRPLGICGLLWCTLAAVIQLVILDAFFILYGDEHAAKFFQGPDDIRNCTLIDEQQQHHYSWYYLQYFLIPDVLTVAAMLYLPIAATLQTRRERSRGYIKRNKVDDSLRYAYVTWCVYAFGIIVKIAVSAKTFLTVLQHLEECQVHELIGVNIFILTLSGSCVVFFLIAFSHHAHHINLDAFLRQLVEVVTFDVLDGVHFLQILFTHEGVEFMFLHHHLENLIILFTCINFVLPAISLLRLSRTLDSEKPSRKASVTPNRDSFTDLNSLNTNTDPDAITINNNNNENPAKSLEQRNSSDNKPNHTANGKSFVGRMCPSVNDDRPISATISKCCRRVLSDQYYSLPFLLLINLPYFIIRCYLWHVMEMEVSVFIVKNALAIVIELGKTANNVRLALRD